MMQGMPGMIELRRENRSSRIGRVERRHAEISYHAAGQRHLSGRALG